MSNPFGYSPVYVPQYEQQQQKVSQGGGLPGIPSYQATPTYNGQGPSGGQAKPSYFSMKNSPGGPGADYRPSMDPGKLTGSTADYSNRAVDPSYIKTDYINLDGITRSEIGGGSLDPLINKRDEWKENNAQIGGNYWNGQLPAIDPSADWETQRRTYQQYLDQLNAYQANYGQQNAAQFDAYGYRAKNADGSYYLPTAYTPGQWVDPNDQSKGFNDEISNEMAEQNRRILEARSRLIDEPARQKEQLEAAYRDLYNQYYNNGRFGRVR